MTVTTDAPDKNAGRRVALPAFERYINILGPLVMISAIRLAMAMAEPRFFEAPNLMIILQDAAIYMVLGMLVKDYGWGPYPAMAAALTLGLCCGVLNGLVITRLKVPDLLATLAMDQIYRGVALVLAAGAVLARFPEPILLLGRGRLFDTIPMAAVPLGG